MATYGSGKVNFTKLGIAVIDKLTGILRDLLSRQIQPREIEKRIRRNRSHPRLRQEQELVLSKAKTVGYGDFDTTFLYSILRNECSAIPVPTNGWGSDPGPSDFTIGDDIERIRQLRNQVLGHIPTASVPDLEFQRIWSDMIGIAQRMESFLGSNHNYVQNLRDIEMRSIDEELETLYLEKLRLMAENEKEVKEKLHEIEQRFVHETETLSRKVDDIREGVEQIQSQQSEKRKYEAYTNVDIEAIPAKRKKQKDADMLLELARKTLIAMVQTIDERSTEEDIFRICEAIKDVGLMADIEAFSILFEIIEEVHAKIIDYVRIDTKKRSSILSRFAFFVMKMRKEYKAKVEVMSGSLILYMTFNSEIHYNKYHLDVQTGAIHRHLSQVLLCESLLSMFDLQSSDVVLKVYIPNRAESSEKTASVETCSYCRSRVIFFCKTCRSNLCEDCREKHAKNISSQNHDVVEYPERLLNRKDSDPLAQHYVECSSCDRNVEYYCNTCHCNVCSECMKNHLKNQHDLVPYREKLFSSLAEFCHTHRNQSYIQGCQKCEVPVCQACIQEKHKGHALVNVDVLYEMKKEGYHQQISMIRRHLLPKSKALLEDVKKDRQRCKENIVNAHTKMKSNAQTLKNIIDSVLMEEEEALKEVEIFLISELDHRELMMRNHISFLGEVIHKYESYVSSKSYASLILFQHENPLPKIEEPPKLAESNAPSVMCIPADRETIKSMIGNVQGPEQTLTRVDTFEVLDLENCQHITPITNDQVLVSDSKGHLILTDTQGSKLDMIEFPHDSYGCHSLTNDGKMLAINKTQKRILKFTAETEKPVTVIHSVDIISSVFSSPFDGDILIGTTGQEAGVVTRYTEHGDEINYIKHDSDGQALYSDPFYITENHINRDICVSDADKQAVVVVDKDGKYRFSYQCHPSGSGFDPYGICTDTRGHILVSDAESGKIHMINKDGYFRLFIVTFPERTIFTKAPAGLALDVSNALLYVGEKHGRKVSMYKYQIPDEDET